MVTAFVQKLRRGASLSVADEDALRLLAQPVQRLDAHRDIMLEGDSPRSLTLILDGWACRYRQLADGRRQIMALFLPGDLCEPYGVLPEFMDHSLGSLTPLAFVRVQLDIVRAVARDRPRIEEALWWDMLVAMATQRERIVSLGRRSATERLAHLLCELNERLGLVGLSDGEGFDLSMTQTELGDALGLSNVHVNRTLKELRGGRLITLKGRRLTIHDRAALEAVALFDPTFLHLGQTATPRTELAVEQAR